MQNLFVADAASMPTSTRTSLCQGAKVAGLFRGWNDARTWRLGGSSIGLQVKTSASTKQTVTADGPANGQTAGSA